MSFSGQSLRGPYPSYIGSSQLNAVVQVEPHEGGVEKENHLPSYASHASFDVVQEIVGFLGWECVLWVDVVFHLSVSPGCSHLSCSQSIINPACICAWIAPDQVHDFALGLVELKLIILVMNHKFCNSNYIPSQSKAGREEYLNEF